MSSATIASEWLEILLSRCRTWISLRRMASASLLRTLLARGAHLLARCSSQAAIPKSMASPQMEWSSTRERLLSPVLKAYGYQTFTVISFFPLTVTAVGEARAEYLRQGVSL
jgi:hypothetical protein